MEGKNKSLNEIQVIKGVLIGFIVLALLSFLYSEPIPLILGLVFGTVLSLLNFRLLYLTLSKAVLMPPGKAQVYASSRYVVRYIITGMVLFIAIKADHINALGTILGLLLIKIVVFVGNIFNSGDLLKKVFKIEK